VCGGGKQGKGSVGEKEVTTSPNCAKLRGKGSVWEWETAL